MEGKLMICLIALGVFSVTGIFSATHRQLAKEAFDCVFRRMTLRKCSTGFDEKMKMKLTGKLIGRSPLLARKLHQHFELVSWALTFTLIISLSFSVMGAYNLAVYGSCDPHGTDCVFNPGVLTCGSEECEINGCDCESTGCEEPLYNACQGKCDCQENTCG
jgi:hypothetical protein